MLHTAQFDALFEATSVAMAYLDSNFTFVRVNQNYARADGHEPEFYVGKNHFDLFPDEDNQRLFEQVRRNKTAWSAIAKPFEYAHNPERGVSHWDWTLSPILDARAVVTGFMLVLVDVSARVQAIEALHVQERKLAARLAEKDVLLREIHHRVKNNLQIVSSLLYLQSVQSQDSNVTRCLDKSRDRIRAMSLVHELLHDSDNLARISFADYLRELVVALISAHQRDEPRVQVSVDVELCGRLLDVDSAAPCGLIVSELVVNALEHAFVGRTRGCVRVLVQPGAAQDRWSLSIIDDGVGLPPHVTGGHRGLGLRLVEMLAEQIGARLQRLDVEVGTHFQLDLPLVLGPKVAEHA